jgi:hypothetical protein
MKHVSFIGRNDRFPFRNRLGCDTHFSRNHDAVHAHQSQLAISAGLMSQQLASYIGIKFTMNAGCEFARHACGPDRAVAIDESQACPH